MLLYDVSPYGFILPRFEGYHGSTNGNKVVDSLRVDIRQRSFTSWDFQNAFIDLVRKLFTVDEHGQNGLRSWINFQLTNGSEHLTYHHYQFIIDTIRFIRSGYRRVQPETIRSILETDTVQPIRQNLINMANIRKELLTIADTISPDEDRYFIYHWLTKDRGFSDLIGSLELMFGSRIQDEGLPPDYWKAEDFFSR